MLASLRYPSSAFSTSTSELPSCSNDGELLISSARYSPEMMSAAKRKPGGGSNWMPLLMAPAMVCPLDVSISV
jgi:hypothetical protein